MTTSSFIPFLVAIATVAATFLGGSFALKYKDKLHLILGFSAGAVMGVAFFDLLPESLKIIDCAYPLSTGTFLVAAGFALFLVVDRLVTLHFHGEGDEHAHSGSLSAVSLSIHSFLDGLGIGLAFKLSPAIGWVVAAAVLAHDFSDGINTVNVILKGTGSKRQAFRWLAIDAIAPALGVLTALFFSVPVATLGLMLAMFAGFFIYIGASDLVPESYHYHPSFWTTTMTLAGMAVIYIAISLAG